MPVPGFCKTFFGIVCTMITFYTNTVFQTLSSAPGTDKDSLSKSFYSLWNSPISLWNNCSIRSPSQTKTANRRHIAEWNIFKHQEVRSIDRNKNPHRVWRFWSYVKLHKAVFWSCIKITEICNYTYSCHWKTIIMSITLFPSHGQGGYQRAIQIYIPTPSFPPTCPSKLQRMN